MQRKRSLKPNTEVLLTVNGFRVKCKVKDILCRSGYDCITEINRRLAAGELFTGFVSRFGDYNIQVNW